MKDAEFLKLIEEYDFLTMPTDAIVDMWEDGMGFVRMTVGVSAKHDIRLQFSGKDGDDKS